MGGLHFLVLALVQLSMVRATRDGFLLASSWTDPDHGTSGEVYAINSNTFYLKNFHYGDDGTDLPPDGHFVVGKTPYSTIKSGSLGDDPTGVILADELGRMTPLEAYTGKDIYIRLPEGEDISEYKYLAVWCRQFTVYFGAVEIPDDFEPPAPAVMGTFSSLGHGVSSGDVVVLDTKTILVKNFFYDGQGPDAFWYIGNSSQVMNQPSPYGTIPDEDGSLELPGAYSGKDVTLTLPEGLTIYDVRWLSFWCISFTEDFGNIYFDTADVYVPVALEGDQAEGPANCEALSDDLQVSWRVMDKQIKFKLAGRVDRSRYMAFGLSGSGSTFQMIGADVTVADWLESSEPRAIDYQLTAKAQCANGQGACPDTQLTAPGSNNAFMPSAEMEDGILVVTYNRAIDTNDAADQIYQVNGTAQQIVWATGPINTKGTTAIHESRISAAMAIDFGRDVINNCPSFRSQEPEIEKPDFLPHHIYGDEVDTFTAEIGQAGLSQGYKALTGKPSWGIAWYINGILVPELHLIRGKAYKFRVNGGDDSTRGSQYHPFYITNDEIGGYAESQAGVIYPGSVDGTSADYVVGPYCEWKASAKLIEKQADDFVAQCFEELKYYLNRSCPFSMEYTEFIWTADDNTPETVFYQCYTHQNLGWKIHVYHEDNFPTTKIADQPCEFIAAGGGSGLGTSPSNDNGAAGGGSGLGTSPSNDNGAGSITSSMIPLAVVLAVSRLFSTL